MPVKVRMVKGSATVVVKGACHVLGSDVSNRTITVRAGKALPFEPAGRCRLRVRLGRGSRMWLADPSVAGISIWREIAQQMIADNKKVVMLVGDNDTGKSTLAAYLANVALGRGLAPFIIDGDIGQGDLAPPTCIGATALSTPVTDLRDASASAFEFVGSISPVGFEELVAKKLRSMLDRAGPFDICIANTDGYARNGGIRYKLMIARELQPGLIICLGENQALFDALSESWQVLRARASIQTSKSRRERTSRRLDQFLRYVGSGSSSTKLSEIRFVYAGRLYSPKDLLRPPIIQLELENLKRMFVGLGSSGRIIGFGIITGINDGGISVQTDVEPFDSIHLGNTRLGRGRVAEIRIA